MNVGIRELKARLSEFVERAASGETIHVTDRGRPKAMLGPLPGTLDLGGAVEEGWLAPGTDTDPVPRRRRHVGRTDIAEAMAEDRGA
jgi:prevent-host-death family protein